MEFNEKLQELRRSKGLTQEQLAEQLGVSRQAISKWENEQCAPDVSMFPILAEFFGRNNSVIKKSIIRMVPCA